MKVSEKNRDASIDRLRGLSVVLMLGANIAPLAVPEPRPFLYRILTTVCAPTFVLLSGMMLGKKPPLLRDAFARGALLLALGGLLDVTAWGLVPFVEFDILYLLGLATPLVAFASKLEPRRTILLALVVLLSAKLGRESHVFREIPLLDNALFEGWFPLFPWLSLGLFGAALGKLENGEGGAARKEVVAGAFLVAIGALEWAFSEVTLRERGGYAELFYPPEHFVLFVFVGGALILRELLRRLPPNPAFRILESFGRRALFVYLAHILLIGRVSHAFAREASWSFAAFSFVGLLLTTGGAIVLLDRRRIAPTGIVGRTVFGGPPPSRSV